MLLQLRNYIQRERVVTTQQLTREFHVDESALEPMLDLWVQKGVIVRHQQNKGCRSICSRCSTSGVYEMAIAG